MMVIIARCVLRSNFASLGSTSLRKSQFGFFGATLRSSSCDKEHSSVTTRLCLLAKGLFACLLPLLRHRHPAPQRAVHIWEG